VKLPSRGFALFSPVLQGNQAIVPVARPLQELVSYVLVRRPPDRQQ
jgi:hypothetical protein